MIWMVVSLFEIPGLGNSNQYIGRSILQFYSFVLRVIGFTVLHAVLVSTSQVYVFTF